MSIAEGEEMERGFCVSGDNMEQYPDYVCIDKGQAVLLLC